MKTGKLKIFKTRGGKNPLRCKEAFPEKETEARKSHHDPGWSKQKNFVSQIARSSVRFRKGPGGTIAKKKKSHLLHQKDGKKKVGKAERKRNSKKAIAHQHGPRPWQTVQQRAEVKKGDGP